MQRTQFKAGEVLSSAAAAAEQLPFSRTEIEFLICINELGLAPTHHQ
jgi:hypothetical protein